MNDLHVTSQFAELKAMLLKHFKRSPPGLQAWRLRSNFYSERACAASSSTRLCLSVTATEHRECSSKCYLPQSFANMSSGNAKIGQPAPDFSATAVVDGQFKDLKLSDYKGKGAFVCSCGKRRLPPPLIFASVHLSCSGKYVVFFFYPLDFTFVCPTEIVAFSNRVEDFRKINCEVIGCSIDSHFTHLAW